MVRILSGVPITLHMHTHASSSVLILFFSEQAGVVKMFCYCCEEKEDANLLPGPYLSPVAGSGVRIKLQKVRRR